MFAVQSPRTMIWYSSVAWRRGIGLRVITRQVRPAMPKDHVIEAGLHPDEMGCRSVGVD
jgi:hypothetical protein